MLSTSSSSTVISSRASIVTLNQKFEVCLRAFHNATVSRCVLRHPSLKAFQTYNIGCFASKQRGFGTEPEKKKSSKSKLQKESNNVVSETSKLVSGAHKSRTQQAPEISTGDGRKVGNVVLDQQFLKKVEAVKRSARELKKSEVEKNTLEIDYDAPVESEKSTKGLGTKVGIGVAVVVFGLVFALGDFVPSVRTGPTGDSAIESKLTDEEKASLKERLRQYEATLSNSPGDPTAVEGKAVTLAELGEYEKASSLLEQLTKERPNDIEVYRLLGEVKFEQKDFDGSASAYKSALSISDGNNFEVLRGLTNSLLAAKKPSEAVQVLLKSREQLNDRSRTESDEMDQNKQKVDPIQVELLLGKAYSDWGHVGDAVAVYDQLISKFPEDFRGYLAKGIILKANGKTGDAERMFIQAKFFAPDKAKALVDRYSRQQMNILK